MTTRIGIDLGGTKIEGIVLDEHGEITARKRIPTPREYDATIAAIASLVFDIERASGRSNATVGIGIPGTVEPNGLVKNANSTWLIGKPLIKDLEQSLSRAVRVQNDANCFAISEAADGAGAGASVVFGVILGTGVGGGIVIDGKPLIGPNLIAGEWGHNPLPWMSPEEWPGAACYCGRHGCIETFLSGPGFAADYRRATQRERSTNDIVADVAAHDTDAVAALERYHDRLARSLATVINLLDPNVIVLGGGMSNLPKLADVVSARVSQYVFSNSVSTRIVKNVHGDSSGVRGAAWLWPAGDLAEPK
ncbi:MAG TPA: ROK family protein [Gemmatimonadaceae bacterium]|jgi:fructokinase